MTSRHSNLTNPKSEPAKAPLEVACTVHFDPYQGAFPRTKLIEWLQSLPEDAKIEFTGIRSGKNYFTATWKETR